MNENSIYVECVSSVIQPAIEDVWKFEVNSVNMNDSVLAKKMIEIEQMKKTENWSTLSLTCLWFYHIFKAKMIGM